jgi:hypothetical protein
VSQSFTNKVFTMVEQRLSSLGFERRKGISSRIPSLCVSDEVLGLVGLNCGHGGWGPGVLDINPVVGVRNQRVERLVAELREEPFNEVSPFTGRNVGYLSPKKKYWPFLFREGDVVEDMADQLLDSVKMYGLPFITANIPLPSLLETMRRLGEPQVRVYQVPVALHLLGKCAEAGTFVEEELANLGPRTDPAAELFRAFADRFRDWNHTDRQRSSNS